MKCMGIKDLEAIKARREGENALSEDGCTIRVTMHKGTCGIAAGAEHVYQAFLSELEASGRKDVQIVVSGCMGMCSSEPNVTIERLGEEPVIYRDLNPEKMREVFKAHIMGGEPLRDYAMARIAG